MGRAIDTMEVIMMGRYRNSQAWKIASRRVGISRAFRLERKTDHDRIFVDNANEENHANQAMMLNSVLRPAAAGQRPR